MSATDTSPLGATQMRKAWVLAHAIGDQANEPSSRVNNGSTLCAFMREPFPFARPNSRASRVMSPQGARVEDHINTTLTFEDCHSFLCNESIFFKPTCLTLRVRYQIPRTQNFSSSGTSPSRLPYRRLQQQGLRGIRHRRILRSCTHPLRTAAHTHHRQTRRSRQIELFTMDEIATRIPKRFHLATRICRVFRLLQRPKTSHSIHQKSKEPSHLLLLSRRRKQTFKSTLISPEGVK